MFCGNAMKGKHCEKGIGIAIWDVDVWKLFLFWTAGLQHHFWFTNVYQQSCVVFTCEIYSDLGGLKRFRVGDSAKQSLMFEIACCGSRQQNHDSKTDPMIVL